MGIKKDFIDLVKACGKDEELLDFVEMSMNKVTNYVAKVAHMEYALPLYHARYDGEEFRDKVQNLDRNRRSAHEAAIAAVTSLNRLSANLGVDPMFKGDVSDRYQIADFCENLVHEFFTERSGAREHHLSEYVDSARDDSAPAKEEDSAAARLAFECAILDGRSFGHAAENVPPKKALDIER